MNVLIIPEDFRKDQYLLKPLFDRLFATCGRPSTKVRVCNPPLLQGVNEALKHERLMQIREMYPMVHLFVLCVDRDGDLNRRRRLDEIEAKFTSKRHFLAEHAWEELETWTLAGLDLPPDWQWASVRGEVSVKERYFDVLAKARGVSDGPGGGRKALGTEAARRIDAIRRKCPEDFGALAARLEAIAAAS